MQLREYGEGLRLGTVTFANGNVFSASEDTPHIANFEDLVSLKVFALFKFTQIVF
jgi:hypothetical protein